MSQRSGNAALIGHKGGRRHIDTPALVLDLDVFEANLRTAHELARSRGIALRPHAKTHKCATIGKAQMDAGAVGLCCAKLGEAEVMAEHGIDRLMLTAPVIGGAKIQRLLELNGSIAELLLVVDDRANVVQLGGAAAHAGQHLKLLIDVDVGTHRFGVPSPEAALALAAEIESLPALSLRGIQGYAGHVQSIPSYAERRTASHAGLQALARVRDALAENGHACSIITGSGTGTFDFDHELGLFTDLQVGSYIFSDVIYDNIEQTPDGKQRFVPALFVAARVVSRRHPGFAAIDAGSKSFSLDGPMPVLVDGPTPGSAYGRFGDEFGKLSLEGAGRQVALGELTTWMVPHCDPTLNLHDYYVCVRGDEIVDLWPIEARGAAA
jgi:D-serine deaminase-like pyridoxal phosphate-dependent protein